MKNGKFDYYVCTNCYLSSKSKLSKEIQTDTSGLLNTAGSNSEGELDPDSMGTDRRNLSRGKNRHNSIAVISSSGKDITMKHMPTQNPFNSNNLAGPSLTKRITSKVSSIGNAGLQKVRTTKQNAFSFNHNSGTLSFGNYDPFQPSQRSAMDFRLFNLSKSGFSSSAKGFKLPGYIFVFVQK